MVDPELAKAFEETRERLPYLELGQYELDITRTEVADNVYNKNSGNEDKYFFVEGSIQKSSGEGANPAGSSAKIGIKLNVSKFATKHMVQRLRDFIAAATGKRQLSPSDAISLLDDSASFVGKTVRVSVTPQIDEDGNPSLRDDGTPWTETKFAAL